MSISEFFSGEYSIRNLEVNKKRLEVKIIKKSMVNILKVFGVLCIIN
jgi:hypothetical protein